MPASVSRPSSPRGRGLAYLASRRSSRDSQFSNEELAPLNFNATARGRQRRTSNFLELPGNTFIIIYYKITEIGINEKPDRILL